MLFNYNINEADIQPYVDKGLVVKRTKGLFSLYCYSKETFFSGDWDDVTRACRGLLFYNGKQINNPFPKIFNLNETEDTSLDVVLDLLNRYEYVLCDKVNGHLTIVTYVPELDDFIIHTKGSLEDNEMNLYDKNLFYKRCTNLIQKVKEMHKQNNNGRMTFMFESVNPTDKHTLYDKEVEVYGDDQLVLLGGYFTTDGNYWVSLPPYSIEKWSNLDNIPYSMMTNTNLDEESISRLFEVSNTEGYVIWFPDIDFRVKIKTNEYWKLRFMKELTPDTIIDKFVSGGNERLWTKYPEEIADKVVELLSKFFEWFITDIVSKLPIDVVLMTRKEVGQSNFSKLKKFLIFSYKDGKLFDMDVMTKNKSLRESFKEYMDNHPELKQETHIKLIEFIEERG